jgi:hypothetical protein
MQVTFPIMQSVVKHADPISEWKSTEMLQEGRMIYLRAYASSLFPASSAALLFAW